MYRYEEANYLRRIMRRSGAWPGMWWVYARSIRHLDHFVYRATRGRSTFTAWATGLPVVRLTTTGAKSGIRRTVPLVAIPNGDALIVIASNFGQAAHPAWCHNLRAHPRVTASFEGRAREMIAHELDGAERDRWYERGMDIYPGWAEYARRTAAHRRIPVFELRPA